MSSSGPADTANIAGTHRTVSRATAAVFGCVFLLVGILGFVPGVTSNYDTLSFASHHSEAMLLGVFQVSVLHNVVHLLFGVAGLLMSRSHRSARRYLVWGGAVYAVLWVYGLLVPHDSAANFVPVNDADDWLHLALAVLMLGSGFATRLTRAEARDSDAA
ncbi:DUF4383 domain-containing protein [Auraticoccus sp. F435]|uniref:DUF4383 domain-containing protein n=1 Tax=Auraticoccus cholistanensis TaxID=2656650 RepID=A0A6A9UVH3_9ACTN|nr:DUF4383 domain-containing protein [Auraticoccus cholistanensis]MVA76688.1 DUF4383 domain-containing protein [Auraticoccus cholistanensis]